MVERRWAPARLFSFKRFGRVGFDDAGTQCFAIHDDMQRITDVVETRNFASLQIA